MAWLSGYLYRKSIPLTGGSDGAFTDFQLLLAIAYVTDHMQSDFDDLRFTKEDGTTLIDAWLKDKTDGTSVDVWVEFPTTPVDGVEQTYYMYYGKSDAVSDWDIGATFLFGDGFETLDWVDKWQSSDQSKYVVSAGILNETALTDSTQYIESKVSSISASVNHVWEIVLQPQGDGTDTAYVIRTSAQGGAWDNQLNFNIRASDDWYMVYRRTDNTEAELHTGITPTTTDWWKFRQIKTDLNTFYFEIYKNNALQYTSDTYTDYKDEALYERSFAWTSDDVKIDRYIVRKYAANPPTYEFGSEENAPSGLTILDFERAGMRGAFRGVMRGVA